jgi:hypothetical protein
VVRFCIPRASPVFIAGARVSPYLNVFTRIAFQPLGGDKAVAVSGFGMTCQEVTSVVETMRKNTWETGCLASQETDERPQLYFSHALKVGNAYVLAREIRTALETMDLKLTP